MSREEIILKKALEDMDTADAMRAEADRMYYNAKKQLAGVYQRTAPNGDQKKPDVVQMAVEKRMKRIFK